MKKLLFAIVGAASFAALAADPAPGANDISIVGFENYTADLGVVGYGDSGTQGDNSLWTCAGEDASLVKTYGGDNAAAPTIAVPAPFADGGEKYLALDTNGSELQRAVGTTVAATGTYIDTLVQFTPSESAPTSTDLDGAKLAIWLGVDSENNTTNLMVQACYWDFADAPVGTSQAFALTGKTIEPGTWYRLTVKAIDNIMNADSGLSIPAFQILVDGTEMTLASGPLSSGFLEILDQSSMYGSADIQAAIAANKLVPSIQAEAGQYGAAVTLTSVGFKGTGAIDDFVVTTAAPEFAPAVIDFTLTLTLDANVAGAVVTTNGAAVVFDNGTAQIPEGTAVSIAEPTYATGYQLAGVTTNTVAVAEPSWPLTFTMDGAMTVAITSEAVPAVEDWVDNPTTDITAGATAATAYPGLASSALAAADAQKLTTWAKAKNITYNDIKNDTTGAYVDAYLLNCAVADVEDEKDAFVANITIAADGTPVVTSPAGKSYNGNLQLKGKVNLSDAAWTNVEAASSTYKFYMYELSL